MDAASTHIRIASVLQESRVNGPGIRSVVHVQGCSLGCGGCFNPKTHSLTDGRVISVVELAETLLVKEVDGVTISGGEPFEQAEAVFALLQELRFRGVQSILIFSGYDYDEILTFPLGHRILEATDILIAGRYVATEHSNGTLLASSNQRAHFLSEQHTADELNLGGNLEITIAPDGMVHLTGFPPPDVRRLVRRLGDC